MAKLMNLSGKRFGRLTVINYALGGRGGARWNCVCGGCFHREQLLELQKSGRMSVVIHGMTRTPEHVAWVSMIDRCTNRNRGDWNRYGGRGITV